MTDYSEFNFASKLKRSTQEFWKYIHTGLSSLSFHGSFLFLLVRRPAYQTRDLPMPLSPNQLTGWVRLQQIWPEGFMLTRHVQVMIWQAGYVSSVILKVCCIARQSLYI